MSTSQLVFNRLMLMRKGGIVTANRIGNDTPLKHIVYSDPKITAPERFLNDIGIIFRTFRYNIKRKNMWVELGIKRKKRELPGRTVKNGVESTFVCAHDIAISTLFQNGDCESNLRRVFGYSNSYDILQVIRHIYLIRFGTPLQKHRVRKLISFYYYAQKFKEKP